MWITHKTTETRPSLSFVRVVRSDYISFLSLTGIAVVWMLHFMLSIGITFKSRRSLAWSESSSDGFLGIAIVVTIVLLALFAFRIYSFHSVFKKGLLIKGTITYIMLFRDRGRIEFMYTVHGKEYNAGSPITKNARTLALDVGQTVDIVVSPKKKRRAFIVDLYI